MNIEDTHTNPDAHDDHDGEPLDATLRLQLRGLRRELPPQRDLWPQIAASIAAAPAPARRRALPHWAPLALAASLLLAFGLAWQLQPSGLAPATSSPTPAVAAHVGRAHLIDREADAMTREYSAALQELQASAAPNARVEPPALRELDRSAAQIRVALDRDPDARFLLERLRHTYQLRLALTQRAALA